MPDETPEVPLTGGTANRGLVVRSGQTVRRPQRPNSDAIHALLGHLEEAGFDGAPRFLGTDVRGREVLSYISGEAVTPPYPPWSLTDAALRSVAELLRRYHEAVAGFDAERLIAAVAANHDWLYAVIEEGAAEGNPGFLTYWHQAHRRVVATRQWYTAERQRLVAALSTAGGTQ